MNTRTKILTYSLVLVSLIFAACNKDEPTVIVDNGNLEQSQGISADELEAYEGKLGISISTRDIVRRGHRSTKAIFTVTATSGNFGQTVDVDQDTHLAQLSFEAKDLSEEAEQELSSGVPITVEIIDENNTSLVTESFSVLSFTSNPKYQELNASSLSDIRNEVSFRSGVKYFLQIVDENALSSDITCFVNRPSSGGTFGVPIIRKTTANFDDTNAEINKHQFTFEEIPGTPGIFAIITGVTSGSNHLFLRINSNGYLYQDQTRHVETSPLNSLPDVNRFKVERSNDNGLYTLNPVSTGKPLRKRTQSGNPQLHIGSSADDIAYFRILTLDIDWNIETLDTKHLQPILPAPSSSFAYNSTLTNCTTGLLTQTIGTEETKTQTSSVAFEESFSMTSRETVGGSLTIGVSTEASFFGSGVEVSAEATASYEQETEITNTSTQFTGTETSVSKTFFSSRTLEVPPGTATVAYDALQTYDNIKVPFIQRYRIKGSYQTGEGALSGEEILTQFSFTNANSGVVTLVGSDFIELTVRGVNTVGNVVDAISRADATDPNCN